MGTHWYRFEDGRPCYEVPNKSTGGMRDVTLRDARTLGLVPSVTTILQEAARPALVNWQIEQALMAALTLPRRPDEPLDHFIHRAREDSKQQAINAADRGSEIHNAVEAYYRGHRVSDADLPFVLPIVAKVQELCGTQAWVPEAHFAHQVAGFGGKVDLHSEAAVIDFKGKDGLADNTKRLAYDEHAMQLAAYRVGLKLANARLNARAINIFFDRQVPGVVVAHEWPVESLPDYYARFSCLLEYWKRRNRYWPEREAQQVAA